MEGGKRSVPYLSSSNGLKIKNKVSRFKSPYKTLHSSILRSFIRELSASALVKINSTKT